MEGNPRPTESSSDVKFEIGHVLFIDIVGYSKLLINEAKRADPKTHNPRNILSLGWLAGTYEDVHNSAAAEEMRQSGLAVALTSSRRRWRRFQCFDSRSNDRASPNSSRDRAEIDGTLNRSRPCSVRLSILYFNPIN